MTASNAKGMRFHTTRWDLLACGSCGGELDESSLSLLCRACLLQAPVQQVSNPGEVQSAAVLDPKSIFALSVPASNGFAHFELEIGGRLSPERNQAEGISCGWKDWIKFWLVSILSKNILWPRTYPV
jgi:hypothetical protein